MIYLKGKLMYCSRLNNLITFLSPNKCFIKTNEIYILVEYFLNNFIKNVTFHNVMFDNITVLLSLHLVFNCYYWIIMTDEIINEGA